MTQPETNDNRSDEDRLRLPASWRRHVLPWRGRDNANSADLDTGVDPGASEAVARRIAEFRPFIEASMDTSGGDRYHVPEVREHLEGRPNPAAAAALMQMVAPIEYDEIAPADRRRHLDAWITDHGLAFATAATIEGAMIHGFRIDKSDAPHWPLSVNSRWNMPQAWKTAERSVHHVRSLLTLVSEREYRAAVAAVEPLRTDSERRVGAALLMPSEAGWVEEAVTALSGSFVTDGGDDWMWWNLAADPRYAELFERRHIDYDDIGERNLAPLIAGLGTAALPRLTQTPSWVLSRLSGPARDALLTAIGLLPTDEAAAHLLDKLELPGVLPAVLAAAERFPQRTLRAVAARARDAEAADRAELTGIVVTVPALMGTALPQLDEHDRATIAELVDRSGLAPAAPAETLPRLLVDPPWPVKRRKAKAIVIDGLEASGESRMAWDEGERERWSSIDHWYFSRHCDDAWWKDAAAAGESAVLRAEILAYAPAEIAAPLFEECREFGSPRTVEDLQVILGRFGSDAAERTVRLLAAEPANHRALPPIVSPAAARLAADWLTRLKSARAGAVAWFDRNGPDGARMLVPDALGNDKKARRPAEVALSYVAMRHGADVVLAAAASHGAAARDAVEALLEADPLAPYGAKVPSAPVWAAPTMLPQVLLKGREAALPPESVEHLVTMLAIDTFEVPYAGVDTVRDTCDGDSLREFSWVLFERWTAVGTPAKEDWAFTQLARFADDATVRRLASLVREWPGQRRHKQAVTGLEVLGAIGSEEALRAVHDIARKVKFKGLKRKAVDQTELIAAGLGLSADQLADRLVPEFGLDDETSLILDYGPRQFKAGFDEQLKPFVIDNDGKHRKSPPKPGAEDDADLAEAAYERFAGLKKDLRAVAADQVRRLERAMASERTWAVSEFRKFFAGHPLMWHLARRLVWSAEIGGERTAFRLDEGKTPTDVHESELDLSDDATVRLAHPLRLGDELDAWTEIMSDYEVLQPFEQLARPVMAFTAGELATGRLTRFEGAAVAPGRILGMTDWGWRRVLPKDYGPDPSGYRIYLNQDRHEPGVFYRLPGGGFVVLEIDPGIVADNVHASEQTVLSARLSNSARFRGAADEDGPHPADVDPVTASEVLVALARITRSG